MISNTLVMVVALAWGQTAPANDASLVLWPDSVDTTVRTQLGCTTRPLGFTPTEMSHFPGRAYRLPYVANLFSDARKIPVETDRVGRQMVRGGYREALRMGFEMLGTTNWVAAKKPETAPEPQPKKTETANAEKKKTADTDSDDAEQKASEAAETPLVEPVDEAAGKTWAALPDPVHDAVEELVRGMTRSRSHIHKAFDWNALGRRLRDPNVTSLASVSAYDYAAAPWTRFGQWCPDSFAALNTFRPSELAAAGAEFCDSLQTTMNLLCKLDPKAELVEFDTCRLKSDVGTICLLGKGDNTYRGGADAVVIDLGGNDRYSGRLGVPLSKKAPIGLVIDLWGNDLYDGRRAPASLACGLFGIGAVVDLGGNDQYYCRDSGLGCAWHGIGLLIDTRGNDLYSGFGWCEGAAHAGVGLLVDEDGKDRYYCQLESQGMGATRGVGILLDCAGDDLYHAYDNERGRSLVHPSSQTHSHELSVVQGAGFGRRADTSDGRSMAGGVGILVDGAGDDSYYGGVFSQGIGFWWALGMLADLGGNDQYRGVYYAQGAAAHFAIGSLLDRAGNDLYSPSSLGESLGGGRDGAIGTMVDVAGNDVYYFAKKSAGSGDMNGLGLFCDQQGNDTYHSRGYPSMGGVSVGGGREYFRYSMPTIGVFVDLSGLDTYGAYGQSRNNKQWSHRSGRAGRAFGLDTETRAQPKQEKKESEQTAQPKQQNKKLSQDCRRGALGNVASHVPA